MLGETVMGLSALKTAFDMAKALKDMDSAVARNAAVIELQESILTAQQAQAALVKRVDDLEKEVAAFEAWETEKNRYELKSLGIGAFVYMLKKIERSATPPHWACTNCYEHKHIAIVQYGQLKQGQGQAWHCPSCKNTILPSRGTVEWMD
jgi:rubrerythrin